jgi:hypothetical protein
VLLVDNAMIDSQKPQNRKYESPQYTTLSSLLRYLHKPKKMKCMKFAQLNKHDVIQPEKNSSPGRFKSHNTLATFALVETGSVAVGSEFVLSVVVSQKQD